MIVEVTIIKSNHVITISNVEKIAMQSPGIFVLISPNGDQILAAPVGEVILHTPAHDSSLVTV